MNDLISRQAAIDAVKRLHDVAWENWEETKISANTMIDALKDLPSAQPTLYGYKIEHLAYIAKVMEKEGVSAEYAVRTFDDMSRTMRMIIEEAQRKVEEALNG